MASYSTMSTIPAADVETEQPLLKRDVKLMTMRPAAMRKNHQGVDMVVYAEVASMAY